MSKLLTVKEKIHHLRNRYFPERQLFLRSEGRVRFITIGTNTQIILTSMVVTFMGWGSVTTYAYLTRDSMLEEKNQTISSMSDQYRSLSSDFSALELDVEKRARQLEDRQRLLEDIVSSGINLPSDGPLKITPDDNKPLQGDKAPSPAQAVTNDKTSLMDMLLSSNKANASEITLAERRSNLIQRLQQADTRQQQFASLLLGKVNQDLLAIDKALSPTKLSKDDIMDQTPAPAMGGPFAPDTAFDPIFTEKDGVIFSDLVDEWQRLQMVTIMLDSFPAGKPVDNYYISSKFGPRKDPIKHTWAKHSGLDMAGWVGSKIMSTAPGKVVYAGWYGPYGKMVEIDHGNGFKTRYGHMRKLVVKKGNIVETGTTIGEMGKTGRATDYHLHYEVWFDGKVRDPLPFLKAASDVLKIQGRNEKTS